jgi:uncharacterized protein (DUF1697 family)
MDRHVALVRNVMIGREGLHRQVLLEAVERSGGGRPRSFISTGNVAFDLKPGDLDPFVEELEDRIEGVIGRREAVYVRTLERLVGMVDGGPFDRPPFPDVRDRSVTFCSHEIEGELSLPYVTNRGDLSIFRAEGREVFSVNRMVDGRTRAPGGIIERMLGSRVTTRAWSTIQRIVALERDPV